MLKQPFLVQFCAVVRGRLTKYWKKNYKPKCDLNLFSEPLLKQIAAKYFK